MREATARLGDRFPEHLGAAVLLILAGAALFRFTPAIIALGLLLAVTALRGPAVWRDLSPAAFTWLSLTYLLYVSAFGLAWAWARPEEADLILGETGRYLYTGYLGALLVAFWVHRRPTLLPVLIGLLPVGLLARVALRWEEGHGAQVIRGMDRARFGDSAVHIGLWSVLALLCGLYLLLETLAPGPARRRALLLGAGLVVTVGAALLLFFSQTRSAWLLALLLVPTYLVAFCALQLRGPTRRWVLAGGGAALAAAMAAAALAFPELLQRRWAESAPALAMVLGGDWAEAPPTSLGLRLHMLREGFEAWSQAPWRGWGPGGDAALLETTDSPTLATRSFEHFHSSLLAYAVELGTVGGLLFLLLFGVPLIYLAAAIRARVAVPEALWCISGLLLLLGGAMADRVLDSYRGPFVSALLVGAAVGLHLQRRARLPAAPRGAHGPTNEPRSAAAQASEGRSPMISR